MFVFILNCNSIEEGPVHQLQGKMKEFKCLVKLKDVYLFLSMVHKTINK